MPTLQIIDAGTHTRPVAQWFGEHARDHAGFDVHIVGVSAASLDGAADAFVFVVDDTATLDVVSEPVDAQWRYKPVGFIGHGSPTVILKTKEALAPLGMTNIDRSITIDDVSQHTEAMEDAARAMLDELSRLDPFLDALRTWAATTELAESA